MSLRPACLSWVCPSFLLILLDVISIGCEIVSEGFPKTALSIDSGCPFEAGCSHWNNTQNAEGEADNACTSVDFDASHIYSYPLLLKDFGFDIPVAANITGIQARCNMYYIGDSDGGSRMMDIVDISQKF